MMAIAATAKAFGVRPSELLGMDDAVMALDFDMAAAVVLGREVKAASEDGGRVERIRL